jgi:catechol 2,3-dioxygenase-like lactoylglutathione lyase family enzyme
MTSGARALAPVFPPVLGLHHFAYRCRDAEETRHFYEDLLALPLAAVVAHDRVPSTDEVYPYCHLFFEMADGSYLAFFDLFDGKAYVPDPATPSWVNHLALRVSTRSALDEAKVRLEEAGVEVLGAVDHGWFESIYFFDPNGIRLELVFLTATPGELADRAASAHDTLRQAARPAGDRAGRAAGAHDSLRQAAR